MAIHSFAPSVILTDSSTPALSRAIQTAIVIAHTEETQVLEGFLRDEGFNCEVSRQTWQEEFRTYARSYLALLNHRQAWERAAQSSGLTLIVEADFVPVCGFGSLPLPMPVPQADSDHPLGIAWLYTCAAQIYSVSSHGFAEGFSTSMVAYLITPTSAGALLEMAAAQDSRLQSERYTTWDSDIESFLRKKGFKNYVPFRNYGEHGGRPNPEHGKHGLVRPHRADVLYAPLAFMPMYALSPETDYFTTASLSLVEQIRYLWARMHARTLGMGRLLTGRFLRWPVLQHSSFPRRLLGFAIRRHLTLRL